MATDILRQVRMHEEKAYTQRMTPSFGWIYMGDALFSMLTEELSRERVLATPSTARGRATMDVYGYVFVRESNIEQPDLMVACDQEGNVLCILKLEV